MSTATAPAPPPAPAAPPRVTRARAPRAPGGTRSTTARAVDVACLVGVLALVLWPLLAVYGGLAALPAIAGGLLLGTGLAVGAAARRWSAAVTVAAVTLTYLVAGGALAAPTTTLAGVVPTPATFVELARGTTATWKQVLTLQPPVGTSGALLVAAYLLALVGSATAVSVALRVRRPALAASAAVVPLVVLVVVVVLGTRAPQPPPAVTGTVAALVLLPWAAARAGLLRPRRVVALGALGAVAAAGGLLGAPVVTADTPRYVVRDEIVPPFDPRDYPSPLSAFRHYVKLAEDTTLLTVDGLPDGARVRLATMDRYDGVVWNVSSDGSAGASGEFRRVGDALEPTVEGDRAQVEVEVGALTGVWLPTVGQATGFDLGQDTGDLRYNDATGAAVLVGGVHKGMRYEVDVVVPRVPEIAEIGGAAPASVTLPEVVGEPDAVKVTAPDVARDAGRPAEVAEALTTWLAQEGYFSHGVAPEDYPSLSGHGAFRMTQLLGGGLMVGDGEQYASALALLAREMGLPARVVIGFVPEPSQGPVELTGADVQAWVEIAFAGHGWVPFDPTPPPTQTPEDDQQNAPSQPDPQVVQPPPPPPEAVTPPDEDTEQPSTDDPTDDDGRSALWRRIATVAGAVGIPLVVLLLPFLVVGLLKARRRRRRRQHRDTVVRFAGGWDEVLDHAHDLRRPVPPFATRQESALVLASAFGEDPHDAQAAAGVAAGVRALAGHADRAVFAPGAPSEAEAAAYWQRVEEALAAMTRTVGWRSRLRSRLSTASLRARRRRTAEAPAGRPRPDRVDRGDRGGRPRRGGRRRSRTG
ncbi:transglutaminase-like domain-containing protein [Cellulomonas fimi]|uniref:Transglutaminase domain-containing protein n=1 Tax=Cellulomonas fimi (strain ATCC 484 / DSM 20113 / JCM 1341 / CCUG 24087 / LMG 16345 / NBRC 15513 / NCIMB 8980 / NCTC 7547 / NRS-133) TaxID=590998 RepID=F4H2W4_CELFA|nr:transglutaminase-like domain-containing protein [Cellulomonas fimi]AEE46463.1 transglutaminase domain-containing protein [Cellulomonas fimi ATCC 484]NNH07755.1 transglutaminase domain-containing protein [Cellulomonas fimi]VEH33105.1 Transglutaminase-like superfamily [Cellulomonas fimi]